MTELDCVIVGAGAAGLSAARVLSDAGQRIEVLEAQARIGGRAVSEPLSDGSPAELGAEVIHGPDAATWDDVLRHGAGAHLVHPGWCGVWSVREAGGWRLELPHEAVLPRLARLTDAVRERDLRGTDAVSAYRDCGASPDEIEGLRSKIGGYTECRLEELDARDVADEYRYRFDGALFALPRGYSNLWADVSRPFAERISLTTPVRAIEWATDGVTVHTDRRQLSARAAVVTASVGVLQAGEIRFDPELSDEKREAIAGLHMVPLVKALAEFRRPFWESACGGSGALLLPDTLLGLWYDYSGYRPAAPSLAALAGGVEAVGLSQTPEVLRQAFLDPLQLAFGDADVAGELVTFLTADWVSNPWTRGGISRAPVGGHEFRRALAAPSPPLFWAGEACAADGNGHAQCVDGAVTTGRNAALRVLHQLV